MKRRLLNLVTAFSLLLSLVMGLAWARSYRWGDIVGSRRGWVMPDGSVGTWDWTASAVRGGVGVSVSRQELPPKYLAEMGFEPRAFVRDGRLYWSTWGTVPVDSLRWGPPGGYVNAAAQRLREWRGGGFQYLSVDAPVPSQQSLASWTIASSAMGHGVKQWSVAVPCWFAVVLTAALPAARAGRWWRRRRHLRRAGRGLCARCGYDLTGNVSGVCPECGNRMQNSEQ